jgi:hypothetical protein
MMYVLTFKDAKGTMDAKNGGKSNENRVILSDK